MAYQLKTTGTQQGMKLDLLNYGLPDTHKTLSIAKLAGLGFSPIVIACDPGGMTTLQGINVPYVEVSSPGDFFHWLGDVYKGKFNLSPYDLICVDGLSNFAYMCLKATGENSNDRRLDYARGNIEFRRAVDDVRRLPLHVYCNAFEGEIKNHPEGARFGPICEGNKFSIQFAGLFNSVFRSFNYVENGLNKVAVQCKFDGSHIARERTASCNPYEPSIDVAVSKILKLNQAR